MYDVLGRLKKLLEDRGLTVYRISKETGIPQSTISTWYSSHNLPPIDKLEIICKALGMSLADFFCDEGTIPINETNRRAAELWQKTDEAQKKLLLDLADAITHSHAASEQAAGHQHA
jgi:transcriptional regulator with XRE-family HTH domain